VTGSVSDGVAAVFRVADAAASPPPSEASDLSIEHVDKAFAGVHALRDVSCSVGHAEIVGLIGPNGAGKTTLFNCTTGFLRPDSGRITFRGTRIDGSPPYVIAKHGVVRTFQSIRMFAGMTVIESLLLAQHSRRKVGMGRALIGLGTAAREMRRMRERAVELIEMFALEDVCQQPCERLSFLDQRRVEVARALATDPELLLVDEPSAGASIQESEDLMEVVRKIRGGGRSILLVEHNMPFVMGLADRIIVLNFGQIVASGTPAEIRDNPIVQEIYLGA